ncbi:unnamed protein product [Soboliphyme baturini]|uniref:FH2 domain-containing protein n=1 Tax=Soboliphyme baturini TaxID=241478 RepID=A0A183IEN8_9BILA|nr:unnamed protein product [Soboliphyme baturini]
MFWAKIDEAELATPELFENINDLFALKTRVQTSNIDISQRTFKKVKDLKVLDAKTAQLLAILQGAVKLSLDEWVQAILEVDETKLSENVIQQLMTFFPEESIINRLRDFSNRFSELSEAEQFTLKIASISKLKPRLQAMNFKLKFPEIVNDVKPKIVAVISACDEVRGSRGFSCLLQLVLLIGNYMNTSTKNSEAFAFSIHFLTKLGEIKSADGRRTLLQYIAETMEKRYPKLCKFTEDFIHTPFAASVTPDLLDKSLREMRSTTKALETTMRTFKPQNEHDKFGTVMGEFLTVAQEQTDLLQSMYNKMEDSFSQLAHYFAFDAKKYGVDEFFGDLKVFKDAYEKALIENAQRNDAERKAKRAEQARKEAEKEKQERIEQKKKFLDITISNQEGVMDSLFEYLNSGQAFPTRSKKSRSKNSALLDGRSKLTSVRETSVRVGEERLSDEKSSTYSGRQIKVRRKGHVAVPIGSNNDRDRLFRAQAGNGNSADFDDLESCVNRLLST